MFKNDKDMLLWFDLNDKSNFDKFKQGESAVPKNLAPNEITQIKGSVVNRATLITNSSVPSRTAGYKKFFKDHLCLGEYKKYKSFNTRTIVQRNKLINPVFVGDTEGDFEAARDCGLDFFQVAYGFGSPLGSCKLSNSFSELILKISGPTD